MAAVAEVPKTTTPEADARLFTLFFACTTCAGGLVVEVECSRSTPQLLPNLNGNFEAAARAHGVTIKRIYPRPQSIKPPDHVPETADRAFTQAKDNQVRGNGDAAGAMYRKAIDVATRALDPVHASRPLASRIDALADAGRLTKSLQEWAHEIRLDGNDATHGDEELLPAEVAQLGAFTELFLTYTFTLPARVAARRKTGKDEGE